MSEYTGDIDLGASDAKVIKASLADISEEIIKEMTEKELKKKGKSEDFPWDLALKTYDSTFPNYTPSTDALDFFNLMRLVQGEDFPVTNCLGHYFMVDLVFGNIAKEMYPYSEEVNNQIEIDQERVAMCCSRDMSKSTIITCFLPVYMAIKGELPHKGKQYFWALLGASARGHGRVMAKGVAGFCEESKFLKDMMESMHFTETEAVFVRKGDAHIRERTFTIKFGSAYSPIRGIKDEYAHRLCGAILDDAIPTTSAAYSKVIMDTLETAIYADIANALKASGGIILNVFTPFWVGDPCTKSILNKSFTPLLLPLAEPIDEEHLDKKSIVSSWPQRHLPANIYKMWKMAKIANKMRLFQQERMLQLVSGQDRLVPDSCIQWCSMKGIRDNINMYSTYITTDYTTTSGENSDFSGIATWALSNNGDWFLLNLTLRKRGMEEQYYETLNEAAQLKRRGKNVELGVEIDGNQSAHVYALEKEMMKRNDYYSFARQIGDKSNRKGILSKNTGVKKHERFRIAVNQYLLPKKMWFPEELKDTPDMIEFVEQIKGATHEAFTRADDGPDLITMLTSLQVVVPTEGIVGEEEDLTTASKAVWGGIFDKDDEKDTSSVIF